MDVFDLYAKIRLDSSDYEKGLGNAKSKFSAFADGLKNAAGAVAGVLADIGKTAAVGIGAAATAMTAITKQSLDQVSQYEQMVGGVEKIFESSAQKVIHFSHQAYESAGLSANEYMETITSFSASLIHSLAGDTERAADLANRAIIDMADNANVFGTDMQSVQYAYQGFAKQNYTMLDNLKLGYGGTAKEMARLLNESGVLGNNLIDLSDTKGLNEAINEAGFAKIIEAIHVTQERLNITNTTANEAAKTLEGSGRAMKAAWQNFLTGVGTPEQFSRQIETSLKNIRENLSNIIPRITSGMIELADLLAPELPKIIEELLPSIIDSSSALITGLAERLPDLLTAILPSLASGVINVTTALVTTSPQLIKPLGESVKIIGQEIINNKDDLLAAGGELLDMIITPLTNAEALKSIGTTAGNIIQDLANGLVNEESIKKFVDTVPDIIEGLAGAIVNFVTGDENDGTGGLLGASTDIIKSIGDYFSNDKNREEFENGAKKFIRTLAKGIVTILKSTAPLLVEAGKTWISVFCGSIDYDAGAKEITKQLAAAFARNFGAGFKGLWNLVTNPNETIDNWLYGGDAHMYKDRLGNDISDDAMNAWVESGSTMKVEDWAAVKSVRDRFGNPNYSDEDLLEWVNEGSTMDFAEFFSDYERRRRYKIAHPDQYVPGFADGGIVSKPTLAWIGERGEKEAVVPLEHETEISRALGLGGGVTIQFGDIYVSGMDGNAGNEVVRQIDEALRLWQLSQKRGVGSAAWQ